VEKPAKHSPGVGGVEPRELEDFELNKLSTFEAELVLLKKKTFMSLKCHRHYAHRQHINTKMKLSYNGQICCLIAYFV